MSILTFYILQPLVLMKYNKQTPVPVAERSKARLYGRSLAGIAGSNPAGGVDGCPLCVWSDRGFCDWPITRPEESYRLSCIVVCDVETFRVRWLKFVRVINAG